MGRSVGCSAEYGGKWADGSSSRDSRKWLKVVGAPAAGCRRSPKVRWQLWVSTMPGCCGLMRFSVHRRVMPLCTQPNRVLQDWVRMGVDGRMLSSIDPEVVHEKQSEEANSIFAAVTLDSRVSHADPIRRVNPLGDSVPDEFSGSPTLYRMYAANGRVSIPLDLHATCCASGFWTWTSFTLVSTTRYLPRIRTGCRPPTRPRGSCYSRMRATYWEVFQIEFCDTWLWGRYRLPPDRHRGEFRVESH